jgi:hypothetical protein
MHLARRPDTSAAARDDVAASELNTHAYCAKAWHLQHVLRVAPSQVAAARRIAGEAHHTGHGQVIGTESARAQAEATHASWFARVAAVLLLAAALLAGLTAVLLGLSR